MMKRRFTDKKTGFSYTLRDGYYLPDLRLPESEMPTYGKYGYLRLEYLKEYKRVLYINLLTQGKLAGHLSEVDTEVKERVAFLIEIMKQQQGVTEELKEQEQIKWVGMMNNIKNAAEEVVLSELVYV